MGSTISLELKSSGKVRDIYAVHYQDVAENIDTQTDFLVMVASDRVSAFDQVIPGLEIPKKGEILTEISTAWANVIDNGWKNQTVFGCEMPGSAYIDLDLSFNSPVKAALKEHLNANPDLKHRSQVQMSLDMIPIECVVRGYITGSLWQAYHDEGVTEFCGLELPKGLKESDKLPQPLYTPTTKAPQGQHDENLTYEQTIELIENWRQQMIKAGYTAHANYALWSAETIAKTIKVASLEYYQRAQSWASAHGLIIADTKFEFGFNHGAICIGDEILTPDSSRFWEAEQYQPGRPQNSLDKQIIRDEIKRLKSIGRTELTKNSIDPSIIRRTEDAYQKCFDLLFKKK